MSRQNANDKKELKPALAALHALPESLGRPQELLADNGYFSGANVELCSEHAVLPYIAVEREAHHLPPNERWKEPEPPGEDADAVEQMRYRLKTPAGRAIYGQRKAVPRARLWDHQIGDGLCAVLSPRSGGGRRGVDSGQHSPGI